MTALRRAALAGFAAVAVAAAAQQPPAGAFRGKVKPGLYDTRVEVDSGGKEPKKSFARQHCLTEPEIDKLAEESNPACKTTNFKMAGDTARFRVACTGAQEMVSDVEIAYNAKGYVTESKVTLKPAGGTPVTMSQLAISKYLGPCPRK